jgi:phage major head subunit gpT-like protein
MLTSENYNEYPASGSNRRLVRASSLRTLRADADEQREDGLRVRKGQTLSYGGPRSLLDGQGRVLSQNGEWSLADTTVNTGIRIGGTSPDSQKVEIAYVGFGTRLNNRLQSYPSFYPQISTVVQSPNLLNREIWLNAVPKMRMWEGPKFISRISAENLPIVTRPHEVSIAIGKGDIINDQLGIYGPKIDQLGERYPQALDDLAITMLCAGVAGTALGATYDGQNLIDTDHTFRSSDTGVAAFQYSNKVTGAFSASVFQSAMNLFYSLKNEQGIPVNIGSGPMMLLHGPANRVAVRNVLQLDTASIGGFVLPQNLDKMTATPVMCPWIQARTTSVLGTSVTLTGLEWFLMPMTSSAVILQIKRAAEFLSVEEGYQVFMDGTYYYGLEAEFGAAYGLPQEIVGGPGS